MITAIATNIPLDILVPNVDFYEASANALQDSAGEGSLVISDIVYAELWNSAAVCMGTRSESIIGAPDKKHVSTSYVERQNLTMRMHMRRFTRLTNAFSKKLENHIAAISLHFMYYNFCRIQQSLRITPAMAAGVTNRRGTLPTSWRS